ncbi:lipopolysaccharide biosynthesis protein [Desulfosporosinus fructosivorans]|uniref:Lipopolysaccharide biosynthesis protein n=1 Tax=Desulfosporosinus fructosivorans TaxID=2018669 RepID=A0A4Z0RDX3_9FIRM|nr:glycoside hydrolase family 99-like domain-containing protein [Desulfosporosinus fructosivorans]TGE39736.1 lipopolysaccharide biosynthesis protein [Desulfosporosinus fructosivorans]
MSSARVIALYLPQFHPVKENDEIWGKGFTEWTNVAKARPQFKGHYQPQIPSELGFYDLRMEETRVAQAELAKQYGIEGFCYWHYWFGDGKRILEMPFQKVVESHKPDFPFCLAWANHSWSTKTWNDAKKTATDTEFLTQQYLGVEDYTAHFNAVLPAFLDDRYIRVEGKPLFAIFDHNAIPASELISFMDVWNRLAKKNGIPGIHFVARVESVSQLSDSDAKERLKGKYAEYYDHCLQMGFDAVWSNNMRRAEILARGYNRMWLKRALYHGLKLRMTDRYKYKDIIENFYTEADKQEQIYPMMVPRWDKTPRQGNHATIYYDGTPELFKQHVKDAISVVKNKQPEHRIVFLQAWNEWGEGNYMEPDIRFGRAYLEALKEALSEE